MSNIVAVNPKLPAAIRNALALAGAEVFSEFSGGVQSGFPILSYKGKVWAVRKGGETHPALNENGDPLPSLEVVLVRSNKLPSKTYYDKKYADGDNTPPRCWSSDGSKPDSNVKDPISKTCMACPMNVWGSKITDAGKKARACSDVRRVAVVLNMATDNGQSSQLMDQEDNPLLLLRVPPASLNPLKDYAEKVLAPKGLPPFAIVTRIGFDITQAHPQFTFKASRFLNETEAEKVMALRESEDARRIIAESIEFGAGDAATEGGSSDAAADAPTQPSAATTSPAPGRKQAMRPATEEEAGEDAIAAAPEPAPAPAPRPAPRTAAPKPKPVAPAAPIAPAIEEDDEIAAPIAAAPAAAPKAAAAAKPKPAAKPAQAPAPIAAAPAEEEEQAGGDVPENIDAMLDSILNPG